MNIQQIGHATLHLASHNETYLIPLPNVKVKGILTGGPYPELQGTYHIPSTNGYMSTIEFGSKGLFSSSDKKHSFEAKVYREGEADMPLYTVSGNWDGVFVTRDVSKDVQIEKYDVQTAKTTPLTTEPIEEQDPWESRLAWRGVREALERGDMQGAADAKSKLENGQREMHSADKDGKNWNRLFYTAGQRDEIAEALARKIGQSFDPTDTVAAWTFRLRDWQDGKFRKPYHGGLRPDNTRDSSATGKEETDSTGTTDAGHTPVAVGAGVESLRHIRAKQHSSLHQAVTISENGDTPEPPSAREAKRDTIPATAAEKSEPDMGEVHSGVAGMSMKDMSRKTKPDTIPSTAAEKSEPDMGEVDSGVAGMNAKEKAQVEDFIRSQYSTSGR